MNLEHTKKQLIKSMRLVRCTGYETKFSSKYWKNFVLHVPNFSNSKINMKMIVYAFVNSSYKVMAAAKVIKMTFYTDLNIQYVSKT